MKRILPKLYPEGYSAPSTDAYQAAQQEFLKQQIAFSLLLEKIDPELRMHFLQIMDSYRDLLALENMELFQEGFRQGAKLMLEIWHK